MMTARLAAFLLALFLSGCSREPPQPPPKFSTWAEQFAAMEKAVGSRDFELVGAELHPVSRQPVPAGEPIELRGHFSFISPKSSGVNGEGKPLYPLRMVRFNDHHLATSLMLAPDYSDTIHPPPPKSGERARLIRLSAQDVLRMTRAEGEAHMGAPVDSGNIIIDLAHTDEHPPEVNAPAAWNINYYGKGKTLTLWIDAQTGAVLKRAVKGETKTGGPEATASPSPRP
jgi:hypothetical protein